MADAELITACLSGEAIAWDALIERYEALIYTTALRLGLTPADAADVFQEVCVLLLHHLSDLRDKSRLAGWLVATTRHEVWRFRRKRGPVLESELMVTEPGLDSPLTAAAGTEETPESALLALEDQHLVTLALERLPAHCRRLLALLYGAEHTCSYAEIAQRLQMAAGSIGPTRARCLQHLRKILAELGY